MDYTRKRLEQLGLRTDDDQERFAALFAEFIRDEFISKTGIGMHELTLRELKEFMMFAERLPAKDAERFTKFCKQYGVIGAKVFLGVQYDPVVGDQILAFAEKQSDERLVKRVFAVFLDLLHHAESAEDYITKTFGTSGTAHETVKASMIASALGLLRTAAESGDEQKVRKIVDALANAPKIALTVGSKALKKSGHLTKETIHDIGAYMPFVQRGSDMSQEYRDTIRAMQLAQYKERAGGYQSIVDVGGGRKMPLWQALDESLLGALTSPDSRFYLLIPPQDAKIPLAASLRFDDRADGVHMASVMTALDGSGVGELHAQASFEKERDMLTKERIYAECDRASGITQKYHEWGFVTIARKSTNERNRDDANALLTFDIEWRKERNDALTSTAEKMTQDEVVKSAQERDNAPQEGENVRYFMHAKPNEDGTNPIPGEKFALLGEGFVMTRYFTRGTTNYAVFERDPLAKK